MATYAELIQASNDGGLNTRIRVACFIAAELIVEEDPATANHAARIAWARNVFANPAQEAMRMAWAVLAQNRNATLAAIIGASDAAVQTAVNNAVNVFAV